ncbi:MAG: RNA methyltransferase [Candidatus Obscuribacterales bacterium]|nr:RNA methyltransferase [Candidatus Obscuribacterales bacterium]
MQVGDQVTLLDNTGRSCLCIIESLPQRASLQRKQAVSKTSRKHQADGTRKSEPETLVFSIAAVRDDYDGQDQNVAKAETRKIKIMVLLPVIKPARFEWALEKLTEVGVDIVQPTICNRSVLQDFQKTETDSKFLRWHSIIREAAEQCERSRLPELRPIKRLAQAINEESDTNRRDQLLLLHLSERSDAPDMVTALSALCNYQSSAQSAKSTTLVVALGPEGGLDASEVALLQKSGFSPVSLGQNILRAETAAIVAIATAAQTLPKMSKY